MARHAATRGGEVCEASRHQVPGRRRITGELAEAGIDISEDTVRRVLDPKARMFSMELVGPVSKILGIPPPVVLPEGEDHARVLDAVPPPSEHGEAMALYLLAALDAIRTRIESDDQTPPVVSLHGPERRV